MTATSYDISEIGFPDGRWLQIKLEFAGEPDAGKLPVAPDGAERDFEDLHDLFLAQPAEITQFHDFGLARRDLRECGKCVVERDHGTIGLGEMTAVSSKFTCTAPAPRLWEPRARAASTRMRRIICAAMAKNWARCCHSTLVTSTRRR